MNGITDNSVTLLVSRLQVLIQSKSAGKCHRIQVSQQNQQFCYFPESCLSYSSTSHYKTFIISFIVKIFVFQSQFHSYTKTKFNVTIDIFLPSAFLTGISRKDLSCYQCSMASTIGNRNRVFYIQNGTCLGSKRCPMQKIVLELSHFGCP